MAFMWYALQQYMKPVSLQTKSIFHSILDTYLRSIGLLGSESAFPKHRQASIQKYVLFFIQHWFICRPSDSTNPQDAGIEPRAVATSALAVRRSNHSARSHPHSARSHPHPAKSHQHSASSHSHIKFLHKCKKITTELSWKHFLE
jgi:hypothetical protein